MKKVSLFFLYFILGLLLVPSISYAGKEANTYQIPDVRDDYCGIEINYQYCKCAFHDEFCDAIGMDQGSANSYVLGEFREWNRKRIQAMGVSCLLSDGDWNKSSWTCTTCTGGDVREGTSCKKPKDDAKEKECKEALKDFEKNWEKYSDFDPAIPVSDASYEVQQYNRVLDEIATMIAEAQALEYDMEIDRQIRLDLRAYKQALVQNIRNNITKSIFRLAWVTYNTVQGAKGTAGSFRKMLNPESVVEGVGATMKVIQAHIPPGAKKYQFDTSKTKGKVKSAAWNATLETLESVGDPVAIATQAAKDARTAAVGGPDLTPQEVAILRTQHLQNKKIDKTLAESYAENAARRAKLLVLEKQIAGKYNELQEWKAKEYSRVKNSVEESCK